MLLSPCRGFISDSEDCLGSDWVFDTTEIADYSMIVNKWAWLRSRVCLFNKAGSGLELSFGVRAWTEMEIRCVKGMYKLKQVSSEKIQGLKR